MLQVLSEIPTKCPMRVGKEPRSLLRVVGWDERNDAGGSVVLGGDSTAVFGIACYHSNIGECFGRDGCHPRAKCARPYCVVV